MDTYGSRIILKALATMGAMFTDGCKFGALCGDGGFEEFGFVLEFEYTELHIECFFVWSGVEDRIGLKDGRGGVNNGGEVRLVVVVLG